MPPSLTNGVLSGLGVFYRTTILRDSRAFNLEFLGRAVEIVKRPGKTQRRAWETWERDARRLQVGGSIFSRGTLTGLLAPSLVAARSVADRSQAELNVARLMIALERFRLARSRWPESREAGELQPPPDPWIDGAVRFARVDGGLVVYALGSDRTDDGGKIHPRRIVAPGYDEGFHLRDVDRRHRLPPPSEPAEAP